ncbi:MAG: ribbon-helix-helix protein, CopG family [Nanoarchaeota archaeon]
MSTILKNFNLDESLIEQLRKSAESEDRSQSAILRRALKKYFDEVRNEAKKSG